MMLMKSLVRLDPLIERIDKCIIFIDTIKA